jgi:hypothetical protein
MFPAMLEAISFDSLALELYAERFLLDCTVFQAAMQTRLVETLQDWGTSWSLLGAYLLFRVLLVFKKRPVWLINGSLNTILRLVGFVVICVCAAVLAFGLWEVAGETKAYCCPPDAVISSDVR